MFHLLIDILIVSSPVSRQCQARLDAWCNCAQHCSNFPQYGPMTAAIGPSPRDKKAAWRCYPVSEIDDNHTWVPHGEPAGICSRSDALQAIIANCSIPVMPPQCPPTPMPPTPTPVPPTPLPDGISSQARVFTGGVGGCVMYRTPSLILLNSGEMLAFSQCRQQSHGDRSPMEIHLKRSKDHGRTWSSATTLPFSADPQHNSLHRAQTVYDKHTGTIFLFDDPNKYSDSNGEAGSGNETCSVHIWRSDDEGISWHNILNTSDTSMLGSGLTNGIQLSSGKLIAPQRNGCNAHKADGAHALWSDDHGATWQAGATTPNTAAGNTVNECQLAPLVNGSLLMIARSQQGDVALNRVSTLSADQGKTWSVPRVERELSGYATCEGSLITHRDALFFSHPQDATGARSNLTIRRSLDNGDSWPTDSASHLLVHAGESAYSCLGETALGELAVLWEADGKDLMFATTTFFN